MIILRVDARQCSRCGDVWPVTDFTPHGRICRHCKETVSQVRGVAKQEQNMVEDIRKRSEEIIKLKHCNCCGKDLPVTAFKTPQNKSCKVCVDNGGLDARKKKTVTEEVSPELNEERRLREVLDVLRRYKTFKYVTTDELRLLYYWLIEKRNRSVAGLTAEEEVIRVDIEQHLMSKRKKNPED